LRDKLIYDYTFVSYDISDELVELIESDFIPAVKSQTCAIDEIHIFAPDDVPVVFIYKDRSGQYITETEIILTDC